MPQVNHHFNNPVFEHSDKLNQKLVQLHDQILVRIPNIDRIACAIYEEKEDLLKTFINSTRNGEAINNYQCKLSTSHELNLLAKNSEYRVLSEISQTIGVGTAHSDWLLKQGYRSSFTVPMYDEGGFLGFIFFDSLQPSAFTTAVQRDLILYCNLINMLISNELAIVRITLASANMARDFANLRDFETGAHLERMARFSRMIAKKIAEKHQLSDETIEHIFLFAPLHDIGKIGIPDHVLLKPGKLTSEEKRIMQTHVQKGVAVVQKIIGDFGLQKLSDSQILLNIVRCHHEFLDGSGYPQQLTESDIPIEARIVTVADIFDALISPRPYKAAWSMEKACAELKRMVQVGQLDADCVAALVELSHEFSEIALNFQDDVLVEATPTIPQYSTL
ncbi:HD-GYP domain-containing protein [Deefgea sp. CFH1-16]|uniref:HD-GYP domain-containing protein n=1 Tax=Deefgea sp. CFH1-16 TaxID=2675457 RepID=UPI0015F556B0|nr:HD-GYP domain-containing protein [Deefgea sp. CFH1-16]MBM5573455.1 HD domain-containing protein [Deefgea sp. CFH1-16]